MPWKVYSNQTYPDYVSGGAYMMAGNITHTLLETIDQYSGDVFTIDDLFITGFVSEKARITRHWTDLIVYLDCTDARLCKLHWKVAIFECEDTKEIKKFWSEWKDTSYQYCRNVYFLKILGITLCVLTLVIVITLCCYYYFYKSRNFNVHAETEIQTFIANKPV